jgi:amino acid adenylation domain-containing protein
LDNFSRQSHEGPEGAPSRLPRIGAAARDEPAPLSFAQQRLWLPERMEEVSQPDHIALGFRLIGTLDEPALRRALDRVVARHEALRTSFALRNGEPVQRVAPADVGFALREHDLRQHDNAAGELQRLVIEEAEAPFDLETGPLVRGRLIRLADREHVLLVTIHPIVADGASAGVLTGEMSALYAAFREGRADPLPVLAIQYADYAIWQRRWLSSEALEAQSDYWRGVLAGAPALLDLPTDRPRPAHLDHAGASVPLVLDARLTAALKALGLRHGAGLFVTLLAGWAALLARLSGEDDVVIGSLVANRTRTEIAPLIGLFANTLALRLDVSGSPGVSELLQRVKARVLEARQHLDVPWEHVVERVRPPRSLAHAPVFQVMFAWQNDADGGLQLPGLTVTPVAMPRSVANFDLTLSLAEAGERIAGRLEYATALFDRTTVERHAGYLRKLLEGMVADDARPVERLPLLGDAERHRLLEEWNATEAEFPRDECIHELFEAQAARTPDAIAVVHEDARLTYGELNACANRLARHLRGMGITPDARVAICVERSIEMVVGLLAILKAGGAYVPLDPAYPIELLGYMLKDSAPVAVLTHAQSRARLPAAFGDAATAIPVIDLDADTEHWAARPDGNPDRTGIGLTSRHLAYVIYTSGSTGKPKGVLVSHQNLVSSTFARTKTYRGFGRFLLLSPISFDSSVAGIFGTLTADGTLIIASRDAMRDASRISGDISRFQVETLLCVPYLYAYLLENFDSGGDYGSLSKVIVAGQSCPPDLIRKSLQKKPNTLIFNEYGPTETTVWASVWHADSASVGGYTRIPIGRPIANTRIYILDQHREPVPTGVAGEIYIGGAGVALGYLNRPELTAEQFLADPFARVPGARMYKSGDLGRYLADGNIEFLGRNDFQVKVRGFRIEPGEIETRLCEHPAVRQAIVVAREDGPGDKQLAAYYTVVADAEPASAEALRRHLAATLPDYMVPAVYVRLETMPLTPNGKLDRGSLARLPRQRPAAAGRHIAATPLEAELADLWQRLLHCETVGLDEDFFELGGDSLLATNMLLEIEQMTGIDLPEAVLFEAATIRALARFLTKSVVIEEKPTVALQTGGRAPPFFFFHGAILEGGFYARRLARLLGPEQPFAVVAPTKAPKRGLLPTIETMAAQQLPAILEAAPHGPLRLGGYSNGGLIAFALARQLSALGREVELVVMIDPPYFDIHPLHRWLYSWVSGAFLIAVAEGGVVERRLNAAAWFAQKRGPIRWFSGVKAVARPVPPGGSGPEAKAEDDRPRSLAQRRWARSVKTHVPKPAPVPAIVYAASNAAEPWRRLSPDLEIVRLDCDHEACVTTHLGVLAGDLRRRLDARNGEAAA